MTRRPGIGLPLAAAAGAASMLPVWLLPAQAATAVSGLLHLAAMSVAAVLLVGTARKGDPVMRRSRLLLAAALVAAALGALISVGYLALQGTVPVPSLVDVPSLAWVPLVVVGFLLAPRREGVSVSTPRVLADALVASSSAFFIAWITVIEPVSASARWSPLGQVVESAYPVLDAFVVAIVLALLARVRSDIKPLMSAVTVGLLLLVVSDMRNVHVLAEQGWVPFGWNDLTLQAALFVFAYAAVVRRRSVLTDSEMISDAERLLPFAPALAAAAVATWHVVGHDGLERFETLIGIAVVISLLLRMYLHSRELTGVAEQYRTAALTDGLTALASRKAFLSHLTEHLSTPDAGPAAVLIADLDGFKEINDTLGHHIGDLALVEFAQALALEARPHLCSRLGGDEFAILVTSADPEAEAFTLAHQVQTTRVAGLSVSCSIGISVLRHGDTPADVLRRADLAMYSAKRRRDSRVAVFEERMAMESERRHLLTAALAGAVERGELSLVYQPILRLDDCSLAGAEALLRWTHPLFGQVPPDEFIPLAEEAAYIRPIGHWVLETALTQVADWQAQGRYLPRVFVNAAAAQFTPALADDVSQLLARNGLDPDRLTLEITESQMPGLAVNEAMRQLRRSGVQVALDDFGTGYSNLAQISRLPVDVIKIDRDFIQNLDADNGPAVLEAVVRLADALGVVTLAEGVESATQATAVTGAGIDLAQGYLYGRPVPAAELFAAAAHRPRQAVVPPPRRVDRGLPTTG